MPLFDSSMSALPILRSHPGARVSLFTCQQGTWAGFRPSRDRLVLSYCCQFYNFVTCQYYANSFSIVPLIHVSFFLNGQSILLQKQKQRYYHRGSNWGSSTRGTALTRYVFIGCCDSGNNPDSNACQNIWRKYIWTPLKIGPGLVMWWSIRKKKKITLWPMYKQNVFF